MSFVPNCRSEQFPTLHRYISYIIYDIKNLDLINQINIYSYQFKLAPNRIYNTLKVFWTVYSSWGSRDWKLRIFSCLNRSAVIYKFPMSGYIAKSANSSTLNKIGLALNSDFCKGLRPKNSTNRLTQSDLLLRWPAFADIDSDWFSNWFEILYWAHVIPPSQPFPD